MKVLRTLGLTLVLALASFGSARAQSPWFALNDQPSAHSFAASTALLLTNGCVMCQDSNATDWWELVPDQFGSYVNGTWVFMAAMNHPRLYYASAALADGTVFVAGGEYSGSNVPVDLDDIEVFVPLAGFSPLFGLWFDLGPTGWGHVGDAPCVVLPNDTVLLGSIFGPQTAIYDPSGPSLFNGPSKLNAASAEETWTLMRNGNVLTADCIGHPLSQFYSPGLNQWINAGPTTAHGGADIVEASSIEIGPAIQLPEGRVICFGATGHNDTYDPSTGHWKPAIDSPKTSGGLFLGVKDGPSALLPNSHVLVAMAPVDGIANDYLGPTSFFEYTASQFIPVVNPPSAAIGAPTFIWRMLLLPTGEVLVTNGTGEAFVYSHPGINPSNQMAPTITNCPQVVSPGSTYQITGTQFNGLSQANCYGDDASDATNYPLVRITNNSTGHVFYAYTYGHSTMAIATGNAPVSTNFIVNPAIELGSSSLEVVANGIASKKFPITVTPGGDG